VGGDGVALDGDQGKGLDQLGVPLGDGRRHLLCVRFELESLAAYCQRINDSGH
jgi:hypothetical protein